MIFTECTENNEIIFNEGLLKNLKYKNNQQVNNIRELGINELDKLMKSMQTDCVNYLKKYSNSTEFKKKYKKWLYMINIVPQKYGDPYSVEICRDQDGIDHDAADRWMDKNSDKYPEDTDFNEVNPYWNSSATEWYDELLKEGERYLKETYKDDINKYGIVISTGDGDECNIYITLKYHLNSKGDVIIARESHIGGNNINNQVLSFSGNNGGSYMHDALYESYIKAKIDSEDRLAFALKENMVISETDYSNIRTIQEAKLSDKVKANWKKFVAFIKNMIARFMESMTNILLDEKAYLEKYKSIILEKKGKESVEYSYTGNYEVGIDRIIAMKVPVFEYNKYKEALNAEGDDELIKAITANKGFDYVDGETLAEQLKKYYTAYDDGQKTGNLADGKIKMSNVYNFCYNFNKIEGIVNADNNAIDQSTRAIEKLVTAELTTNESAILHEEETDNNQAQENKEKESTDPTSKMKSTEKTNDEQKKGIVIKDTEEAKKDGKSSNDFSDIANKWIRVCQAIVSAKLTACQQIAKDYMEIIRAHVRSYVGTDKNDKTGNKSADSAKKYSNAAARAEVEANKAKENVDKNKDQNTTPKV